MDEENFAQELEKLNEALEKLLGKKIIGGRKDQLGLVGLYYHEIGRFHSIGKSRERNACFEKLKRLCDELICAQTFFESNKQEYRGIVRKLISSEPSNNFGARAELMMLSFLMEDWFQGQSIELTDIEKGEAPDYTLRYNGKSICFEVTSAHVGTPKNQSIAYKIDATINKKARKPYANRHTAVFLDITNILYRDLQTKQFSEEAYSKVSYDALSGTNFGSVVLMFFGFNSAGKYIPNYFTVKHPEIDPTLSDFLDTFYPNNPDTGTLSLTPTS